MGNRIREFPSLIFWATWQVSEKKKQWLARPSELWVLAMGCLWSAFHQSWCCWSHKNWLQQIFLQLKPRFLFQTKTHGSGFTASPKVSPGIIQPSFEAFSHFNGVRSPVSVAESVLFPVQSTNTATAATGQDLEIKGLKWQYHAIPTMVISSTLLENTLESLISAFIFWLYQSNPKPKKSAYLNLVPYCHILPDSPSLLKEAFLDRVSTVLRWAMFSLRCRQSV